MTIVEHGVVVMLPIVMVVIGYVFVSVMVVHGGVVAEVVEAVEVFLVVTGVVVTGTVFVVVYGAVPVDLVGCELLLEDLTGVEELLLTGTDPVPGGLVWTLVLELVKT